jgi:MFS family permease|tara:strand:- start:603 stop:1739 length:1137 start_codon:yes stop_codon:yes gene_type:complete
MCVPALIPFFQSQWSLTSTQAGGIQGSFTTGFAVSLLCASTLSDKFDVAIIFRASNYSVAVATLAASLLVDSYVSALIGFLFVGLAYGGTYIPSVLIVSKATTELNRGAAVGWLMAGMSAGYILSIILTLVCLSVFDSIRSVLVVTGGCACIGCVAAYYGCKGFSTDVNSKLLSRPSLSRIFGDRESRLLTVGYVGHCWELYGFWTWAPAYLLYVTSEKLGNGYSISITGIAIGLVLHASGAFSSVVSGVASDRYGRVRLLRLAGAMGVLCSMGFGWAEIFPLWALYLFAAVYAVSVVSDSSVLSAKLAEKAPVNQVGVVFGIRSILGIGAAAISPIIFGVVFDLLPGEIAWGIAFCTTGLGGVVATVAAYSLSGDSR